jgi:hypothetical protein
MRTRSLHHPLHALDQHAWFDGFGEEGLESSVKGARTVQCVDVRADGNGRGLPALVCWKRAHLAKEFVSVLMGHCDVRQDHLWADGPEDGKTFGGSGRDRGLGAVRV